jgi:hypothetical protein
VLLNVNKWLRRATQRRQRLAYIVIALMLLVLAKALGNDRGFLIVFGLWAAFLVVLEFGYRKLISLEIRNRRKWWAKARSSRRGLLRLYVELALMFAVVLIHSPFARYSSLALLAGGTVCFGIIRALHRNDGL